MCFKVIPTGSLKVGLGEEGFPLLSFPFGKKSPRCPGNLKLPHAHLKKKPHGLHTGKVLL